jgi:glucokinase
MEQVLGIDIGGTTIKAGLVSSSGKIISKLNIPTGTGFDNILKNICSVINHFNKKYNAIGIGIPGVVDKGVVKYSPNLPFKNFYIKKILEKKFNKPVFVDNDANCFVLGEALYGAGKGNYCVVGLTLGTGIGGGIVINKKIFHGKGGASEPGHITINFNGPLSRCGNKGCLETYVSKRGIIKESKNIDPRELFILARKGNKKAVKIWNKIGFYLGLGITNIANVLDPNIVVIGGNIANAWLFFSPSMKETIKKHAFIKGTKVVKSKLGENAAILGAASLCF